MELARITATGLNISTKSTVFSYTYTGAELKEVIIRANLGDNAGPIAGNFQYLLEPYINAVLVSPAATVPVPSGATRTIMVSRVLPLESGDVLSLKILGAGADTAVNGVFSVRDATPLRADELTGSGGTLVDHDYGGTDALRYVDPDGLPIARAEVRAYLAADYAAGRRGGSFVVGRTLTTALGRWSSPLMLDADDYVLVFSKAGEFGPDVVDLTVTG